MKSPKIMLAEKWKSFIVILFDPWIIIMILATIGFVYLSTTAENNNTAAIFSIIISVVSGILGGLVTNRWSQMMELQTLITKGKSAIRSLKLILLNLANVEKRTQKYINSVDPKNIESKLVISNFEEIVEKCNILEEEVVNSIENWTDIIPEVADLPTQLGEVSKIKEEKRALETEINTLHEDVEKTKNDASDEKKGLQEKLLKKEKDLEKVKNELFAAEHKVNSAVFSGMTGANVMLSNGLFGSENCSKCGKSLNRNPGTISIYKECEDCRNTIFALK